MLVNKLNIGDTIGIISPSAPITQELKGQFNRGLQVFKDMGFKIELSKNVYANTLGYSSTVSEKVKDINEMFAKLIDKMKCVYENKKTRKNKQIDYILTTNWCKT